MRSIPLLSTLTTFTLLGLFGCSGADEPEATQEATGTIRLHLTSSDGVAGSAGLASTTLRLPGSPLDARYVPQYPNPDQVTTLDFTVSTSDGVSTTSCSRDGVAVRCSDSPFFVEINTLPGSFAALSTGSSDGLAGTAPVGAGATTNGAVSGASAGSGGAIDGTSPPDTSDGDEDEGGAGGKVGATGGKKGAGAPPGADSTTTGSDGAGAGSKGAPQYKPGTRFIHVYDVHGVEVARTPLGTSDGTSPPGASSVVSAGGSAGSVPTGSTCTGAAVGGAPGNGGFSKNGTTAACQSFDLPDRPGCDGSTVASASTVYCNSINEQLGAGQAIDCSVLTNPGYSPTALPTNRQGGDCSTYWEPARSAVQSSQYGSCEKVGLLLTQWRDRSRHELIAHGVCTSSPLVLDLDGDGIRLSSLEDGVSFDLLGAGQKVRASWTDGKDAFLALDRNGNGVIDDAKELFGNATGGDSHSDGFAALAELDDNGDGLIDRKDRAFSHLVVWRDANRDGVGSGTELVSLREGGVKSIPLTFERRDRATSLDANGNSIPLLGEFERTNGTRGLMVDAFLRFRP